MPKGNTSVSFEVEAKGVGQVTVELYSNDSRVKRYVVNSILLTCV